MTNLSTFAARLGVLLSLAAAPMLHAAENVTLTNGFTLLCDHREPAGDRVRLYTSQGSSNFVEVGAGEIASVEPVPDPAPNPSVTLGPRLSHADVHELIAKAGAEHNLDVDLLASVIRAESGGNIHAVSRTGAQGLMQLMPATAAQLGVTDSFQADQNIHGGTAYLDALLLRFHDQLALALAAYNAGPAAVDKYHGIPPYRETRVYVARVIREFNRRKELEKLHPSLYPSLQASRTATLSSMHASQ
ncbi:MAG: lytic transglycosylase domain-containing protein [Acidobacteriaceae bacterium]